MCVFIEHTSSGKGWARDSAAVEVLVQEVHVHSAARRVFEESLPRVGPAAAAAALAVRRFTHHVQVHLRHILTLYIAQDVKECEGKTSKCRTVEGPKPENEA